MPGRQVMGRGLSAEGGACPAGGRGRIEGRRRAPLATSPPRPAARTHLQLLALLDVHGRHDGGGEQRGDGQSQAGAPRHGRRGGAGPRRGKGRAGGRGSGRA